MDYIDYLMNINENEGTQDPILQNIYSPIKRVTPTPTPARRPDVPPVNFGKPSTQPSMIDFIRQGVGGMFEPSKTELNAKKPILVPYQSPNPIKRPSTITPSAPTNESPIISSKLSIKNSGMIPPPTIKGAGSESLVGLAKKEAEATTKTGEQYLKDMASIYDIPTNEKGELDLSSKNITTQGKIPYETSIAPYKAKLGDEQKSVEELNTLINEQIPKVTKLEEDAAKESKDAYAKMGLDLEKNIASLDGIEEEIKKLSAEEIDPSRYWKDKTTGQKVMMGIGLIMAAMTPESMKMALNGIEKQIDQDINAQKSNIARKILGAREQKGAIKNKVEYYTKLFDNKLAGTLAAKNDALMVLKRQLESKKNTTENQGVISNLAKADAEIQIKIDQNKKDFIDTKREQLEKFAGLKEKVGMNAAKSFGVVREALNQETKNQIDLLKQITGKQTNELDTQIKQERLKVMKKGQAPKLAGDLMTKYTFYTQAIPLVENMYQGLKGGDWLVKWPGTNKFLHNRELFFDFMARPESGAAIPVGEKTMYLGFVPTKGDIFDEKMQMYKLNQMLNIMKQRKLMIEKNARGELIPAKGNE